MVEAIMSTVILKLTSLIAQKITDEIEFEGGLSRELDSIKNELQIITAFLRDAEDRAERSYSVKAWVRQVRDVVYRMEDVIDEHVMLAYTRLQNQAHRDELYCLSFTLSILSCQATQYIKEWFPRRKIASSIADIKAEVLDIQQRKVLYNLEVTEKVGQDMDMDTDTDTGKSPRARARAHMWQDPRVGFLYPRESDLVGIEDPKSEIFKLLDLEMKDLRSSIVSIVGMGGIGKTTLAWKVYENIEMKRHFYVCAWVNVTQFYNRKDVFRRMLQEFHNSAMQPIPAQVRQMDEMSLVAELRTFLEGKRYMVVFDDVWEPDLWNYVKNALPGDDNGSRIILTTRQENVALNWKGSWTKSHIYKLQLLPHNKAWELFCKKAFEEGQCPKWLEEVTHSIIAKCGGLPLALVTLGGLLLTKAKAFAEWKKFRDSLGSELEQNPQLSNILRILFLSYNGLPHFLKPCLIYFSIFPESSSIECNRLIKLWIAEDFIKEKRGITVEDVAKEYLLELIQRNLVQVSTWYHCGRARTIRVHDLLHEILRQKLEELNFGQILMAKEENREVNIQSRRLSIQEDSLKNEALKYINSTTSKCSIRSLFTFGVKEVATTLLRSSFLSRFYLLKVLDLQSAPVEELPTEVGELFLLQYLSLRSTKVKRIPKTIGKLINLITLDLKKCPVCELPVEIGNLRRLRHLIVYQNTWHNTLKVWEIRAVRIPEGALGGLESLQKLADVNIATSDGFIDQLGAFKKLRYMAISNVKRENSWILCKAIEKLDCLESLNISVDYESCDPLDLQHITSPPLQLQRLYLAGPLEKFPDWIGKLENLNKLRFKGSRLEDIPLDILQDLPNLTMLGINKDVYYGERLVFHEGGFKKLKALYFNALINLNLVEMQYGALPILEDLLITRSPKLKEVPHGLQYLTKLTSLRIVEMPEDFVDSISLLPHVTKHVADIRVGYQTPTGHFIYKKL